MRNMAAAAAATAVVMVVVVMVVEEANGMPLKPEPRKFVYQPGFPSVKLYPVHFEHYLNSSSGRIHLLKEGSPVLQGFRSNMLQPKTLKPEKSHDMAEPKLTPTLSEMEIQPILTTVPVITSPVPISEPKSVSITTTRPMTTTTEDVTTLHPQAEEEPVQPHTDASSHNMEEIEPVTEVKMMLEEDLLTPSSDGEEDPSGTEIIPLMEDEIQTVTELPHDGMEAIQDGMEMTDDETVTEPVLENEMATEVPTLRETEVV